MESGALEIGGLRVAYRRAGQGPVVMLLHGILADGRAWIRQLRALSDRFTVIAWDAPGAGESSDPAEDFGLDGYVGCLGSFMEGLEIERANLVGLSWGGVLAQEMYRRHPQRISSLVLADTYAGWRGSLPTAVCEERLAGCLRESEQPPESWVRSWLPGLLTDAATDELREEVVAIMSDMHPSGYRTMALALAATDTRDLLPRIEAPTLLLWGEQDRRSPLEVAKRMQRLIPGAVLEVIPGAGHESNIEQPARFNAAVTGFCELHG